MKKIGFLLLLISSYLNAQTEENDIKFNSKFYEAVDKWAVFPSEKNSYPVGIIYIDQTAGFTYRYIGNLELKNGIFEIKESLFPETGIMMHRLSSNTKNVHILDKKEAERLEMGNISEILNVYKMNSDSDDYKIDISSFYNAVGGSEIALPILKEVYSNGSSDKKLLFELSYAYNALKEYSKAEEILLKSIMQYPEDELFYKELCYAYIYLEQLSKSEATYKSYLRNTEDRTYQSEMAYNLTYSFFAKKNKIKFNEWADITSKLPNVNPTFLENIKAMKQQL